MENKQLSDFLPDKQASFFKNYDNEKITRIVTQEEIIKEIKKVFDPEIPVNLYDLGLIYKILVDSKNNVSIDMTLTNPNCPVAGSMPKNVALAIEKIDNISSIKVSLIWEPKWDKSMMSEEAKLALDIF